MEFITSRQNPHFKRLMTLHKRKDPAGQFLVEGEREIALAPVIDILYYSKWTPFVEKMEAKAGEMIAMDEALLEEISYRGNLVIAVCPEMSSKLEELKGKSLLLACESIEKPGNLGGMLRTADGAGVEGVIVANRVVDLFNPNVVRASLGALFCLPVVQTDTETAIQFLKKEGFQIVVATPHATKYYYDIDFKVPTCIVIGSEAEGVTDPWMRETRVKIPMLGRIDCLNASISASILVYEAQRQRNTLLR